MSGQVARKVCSWCPHAERSKEHHNFFFAVCATAYKNWPEHHAFQPNSAEHLRAWILVEIGWKQEHRVDLKDAYDMALKEKVPPAVAARFVRIITGQLMAEAKKLMDKPPLRIVPDETGVTLIAPKSIAKAKCAAKDYDWVCDKGVNELAHHVGVPVDLLRQEGRKAQREKAA